MSNNLDYLIIWHLSGAVSARLKRLYCSCKLYTIKFQHLKFFKYWKEHKHTAGIKITIIYNILVFVQMWMFSSFH